MSIVSTFFITRTIVISMKRELFLATNNAHKLEEYREILFPLGYLVYSPKDLNIDIDPKETGKNYRENAYLKAKAFAKVSPFPVIADDSGIEVTALNNEPGIYSARYADSCGGYPRAMADINKRLEGKEDRSAAFICCICYLANENAKPLYFEGVCPGYILPEPVGSNGFGYDPCFHASNCDADFGTAPKEIKNTYSHRALALRKLKLFLVI